MYVRLNIYSKDYTWSPYNKENSEKIRWLTKTERKFF